MTPKFIEVTLNSSGLKVMVNPRRVNFFSKERVPTQQPDLDCGTRLDFGRSEILIVKETVEQIKSLLK